MNIQVMTYNICSGHNMKHERRLDETAAFIGSIGAGTLYCPWLDSLAALPGFGIALCLLGLFHSKKTGNCHFLCDTEEDCFNVRDYLVYE